MPRCATGDKLLLAEPVPGPTTDKLNACTEAITPERVRNVPKIVREKVTITRTKFQA